MRRKETVSTEDELARARRRVSRMGNAELYDWADAAGSGIYKAFSDYRAHGHLASLEEISGAVTALRALTDELMERHEART